MLYVQCKDLQLLQDIKYFVIFSWHLNEDNHSPDIHYILMSEYQHHILDTLHYICCVKTSSQIFM